MKRNHKLKYLFVNDKIVAKTYATVKEMLAKNYGTRRDFNKLVDGDISITKEGWIKLS